MSDIYKYFDTKGWIWVASATGKGMLLNDPTTTYKDPETGKTEWFHMAITDEMAKKQAPVLVPDNTVFSGHLKQNILVQVDPPKKAKSGGKE